MHFLFVLRLLDQCTVEIGSNPWYVRDSRATLLVRGLSPCRLVALSSFRLVLTQTILLGNSIITRKVDKAKSRQRDNATMRIAGNDHHNKYK